MKRRFATAIIILVTIPFACSATSLSSTQAAQPGYTISRTHGGFRLTPHFTRNAFPKDALVKVTITLRNLSRRDITVPKGFHGLGRCGVPIIQIISVNAMGQSVEPVSPIALPICHGPNLPSVGLSIGHNLITHQLIVLRSSWLHVQAGLAGFKPPCYCGFNLRAPALYPSPVPAPTITIHDVDYSREALISSRPPGGGPLYYQEWGYCYVGGSIETTGSYWHRARGQTIKAGCPHPDRWHIDVAWLNAPVATLSLGTAHRAARYTR